MTYPSGNRVDIAYGSDGRATSLAVSAPGANPVTILAGIRYQPFGPVRGWTWGNSTATSPNIYERGFDLDGRIVSYPLGHSANNGTVRTLKFDAAGRIIASKHTGAPAAAALDQRYDFDDQDRLIGFDGASTSQRFQYDASGNRTQATFGAHTYLNTINLASNRLSSTTGPAPAKKNSYDDSGNLTSDGTTKYSYGSNGRLSGVVGGGVASDYRYNGLGQRVVKASAGGAVYFVYDESGRLLGEYDGAGKAIQETVYLGDLPVAVLKPGISGSKSSPSVLGINYVYADHLTAPRVLTRASDNKMVWRWDNADPFGVDQPDENPGRLGVFTYNLRFPGQVFDKETNNHYNYFRDYDPQMGRYVQSDPIGLKGGINTYAYVGANPVGKTDPLGLWSTDAHNYFIDTVFKGLNPAIQDIIKNGSAYADSMQFQDPSHSYIHAMSSDSLSPTESKKAMCKFIKDYMGQAEYAKENNDAHYWFYLGMALHPVMDSTSPAHEGFQKWHGIMEDGSKHGPWPSSMETISVARRAANTQRTVNAMNNAMSGNLRGCGCP
jgi:RHS repeat-associated protein